MRIQSFIYPSFTLFFLLPFAWLMNDGSISLSNKTHDFSPISLFGLCSLCFALSLSRLHSPLFRSFLFLLLVGFYSFLFSSVIFLSIPLLFLPSPSPLILYLFFPSLFSSFSLVFLFSFYLSHYLVICLCSKPKQNLSLSLSLNKFRSKRNRNLSK